MARNNWGGWAGYAPGTNFDYEIEKGPAGPWGTKGGKGGRPKTGTTPVTPVVTETPTETPTGPTAEQQSAWAYMQGLLDQYGLGSLGSVVQGLISGGMTDPAQLQLELQGTNEWKTRFAGNEALRAAGLPVMSVAEYLSVERSYAQIMSNYGLPSGFYDDPSDFAAMIGGSVSARELEQRVSAWSDLANREDPAIKEQLRAMGIADGDLIAYMMDPARAQPLIQKTYQQALVGGAARRNGLNASGASRLVEAGITEREAMQGFGVIGDAMPEATRLGDIYGEDVSQTDLEAEVFENSGGKKRKRLASRERAAFQGTSGVGQGSLSRRDNGSY
jgi:hypothetical protein